MQSINQPNHSSDKSPRIVLGVSGSIAAYKAADIASGLVREGFTVYPILTRGAAKFIGCATFTALTGTPCPIDTFDEVFPGEIAHIWLARHCDAVVIAPASMNLIARLAHGLSDDMLTAVTLATQAPILLAPAMNTGMWDNPATRDNLEILRRRGYYFVDPVSGRLACRTVGAGKLADVPDILSAIRELLAAKSDLAGKRVLITAGPTREPIDPVRFLSNRSSGKMGYALAERAQLRGANVTLVSGPTSLSVPAGVDLILVETGAQMEEAVLARAPHADIVIAAAAVADFRPEVVHSRKIKKDFTPHPNPLLGKEREQEPTPSPSLKGRESGPTSLPQPLSPPGKGAQAEPTAYGEIKLVRNPDILAAVGRSKRPGQVIVGFAAETDHLIDHAKRKLVEKNLDLVVANDVTVEGAGFEIDTNIVTIIRSGGDVTPLPLMTKREVADHVLDAILSLDADQS